MSEAITADIPLKPVAGLKPIPLKPEPPEPAKPDAPAAITPPPPPEPPGFLTKLFAVFGLTLTRRQAGVSAAAIGSLLLGIVGVKVLFPNKPPAATQPLAATMPEATKSAPMTAPVEPPLTLPVPPVGSHAPTVPPIPAAPLGGGPTPSIPVAGTTPPAAAGYGTPGIPPIGGTPPLVPPAAVLERQPESPLPPPAIVAPPLPGNDPFKAASGVTNAGGIAPLVPPSPIGVPAIPDGSPGNVVPAAAAFPVPPVVPKTPPATGTGGPIGGGLSPLTPPVPIASPIDAPAATGNIVPPISGGTGSPIVPPIGGAPTTLPALPPIGGATATPPIGGAAATPPVVPPVGAGPSAPPPLVGGVTPPLGGTTPPPKPFIPEPPAVPSGVVPPVTAPPAPPSTLAPPAVDPPAMPKPFEPPPARLDITKTAGSVETKPLPVSQSAPSTTFDVDLHRARASDTYETICREFYNEAKYAAALKQYNRGMSLANSATVEVPPIHVLKKQFPGAIPTGTAAGPGATPNWGSSAPTPATTTGAARQPEFRASKAGTYTVPAGGATIKQIARQTLGSDQRWRDIWDLNPSVNSPDEALRPGDVVKLPSDAKVPQ